MACLIVRTGDSHLSQLYLLLYQVWMSLEQLKVWPEVKQVADYLRPGPTCQTSRFCGPHTSSLFKCAGVIFA